MYCRNCKNELREGAKFCPKCGTRIINEDIATHAVQEEFVNTNSNRDHSEYSNHSESIYTAQENRNHYAADTTLQRSKKRKLFAILASVAGLIVIASLVIVIFMINSSKSSQNYVKTFKVYKDELQQAKEDIDNYADHVNTDNRKLVTVYDVFTTQSPSLVYVVEGKDNYNNDIPVIRVCDTKDDAIHCVYESTVDYSPVENICLLKDSQTGNVYLFSDSELPKSGNVVIYSLYMDHNEIKQDEKCRLSYLCSTDNEDEYEYQYFIDKNNVSKEDYQAQLNEYIDMIDTTIVSGKTAVGGLKYDYFNDTASVSMSYDDAIEYLNTGISGTTPDEIVPKKALIESTDDYVEPTESPKVYDIDPSDLPEDLTEFLQVFTNSYTSGENYKTRAFDCKDISLSNSALVNCIVRNPTCVNPSLYPGGKVSTTFESYVDPLGEFQGGTLEYPKDKLIWVLKNIFHIGEKDAYDMLQSALDNYTDLYEYEKDGEMYLYRSIGGVGGPGYVVAYDTVRFDGEKYYIIYDQAFERSSVNIESSEYYVEVSLDEIGGESYWTMYKHTSDIPELPKVSTGELTDSEIYSMFAGSYTFTSGAGFWSTFLELKPEGTFTGEFHDTNMGERGEGYDATVYYSKFSGYFENPRKINAYTYSFELGNIAYENEPETEEIGNPYDNDSTANLLIKYSTAYGLDGSTKTVYAYTPSAPVAKLPKGFMSWIGHLREQSLRDKPELSYKCLYAVEPEYGWIGSKE